jgi:ABC-type polysaccharide/polyol phosphate transport system ATPase subunit
MAGPAIEFDRISKLYLLGEDLPGRPLAEATIGRVRRLAGGGKGRKRDEIWSLRDVSFSVEEGQSLGIIGRNGAGKTTALKILSRITQPTSGLSRTRGRVASLLEVGTGFHPELTGRENVYLNGAILGMTRSDIARRFDDIVEFSGVGRFLDTPIKRYSSGMHLRLAFAVAAHVEPDILLVDEILAVGDAEFQRKCLRRMADVEREGRTVVFVSHDLEAIARLCPTAIWLERGEVQGRGQTGDVVNAYVGAALGRGRSVSSRAHGGPVMVHSVATVDARGNESDVLRRDQPFSIIVRYSLSDKIPGFDLSLHVVGEAGVRVFDEAWSDTHDIRPATPGEYELTLKVPPVLVPGEYRIGLWVGTRYETMLYERVTTSFRLAGSQKGRRERVVELLLPWDLTVVRDGKASQDAPG